MPAAEPVLPAQVKSFYATFAEQDLHRKAIKTTYGLAEATLLVTAHIDDHILYFIDVDKTKLERGHAVVSLALEEIASSGMRRYTSNGNGFGDQDLRFVNSETQAAGFARPALPAIAVTRLLGMPA